MPVSRTSLASKKSRARNKKLPRDSFLEPMRKCNRRATSLTNQYASDPSLRHIRAALMDHEEYDAFVITTGERVLRWLIALCMIPFGVITTHTLFDALSNATLSPGFWYSPEFWLFATGAVSMIGWFFTKLKQRFFLHLYVLGHEFTHAIFAMLHLGRIADLKANANGGYIATNKHNVIISLSPYFFPFWSVMTIGLYGLLAFFIDLPEKSEHALYLLTGATWTFHILWTLWMIPRDQPDLRDNDTFFSLIIIYLANVLLLSLLLCIAVDSLSLQIFYQKWISHANVFWQETLYILRNSLSP